MVKCPPANVYYELKVCLLGQKEENEGKRETSETRAST